MAGAPTTVMERTLLEAPSINPAANFIEGSLLQSFEPQLWVAAAVGVERRYMLRWLQDRELVFVDEGFREFVAPTALVAVPRAGSAVADVFARKSLGAPELRRDEVEARLLRARSAAQPSAALFATLISFHRGRSKLVSGPRSSSQRILGRVRHDEDHATRILYCLRGLSRFGGEAISRGIFLRELADLTKAGDEAGFPGPLYDRAFTAFMNACLNAPSRSTARARARCDDEHWQPQLPHLDAPEAAGALVDKRRPSLGYSTAAAYAFGLGAGGPHVAPLRRAALSHHWESVGVLELPSKAVSAIVSRPARWILADVDISRARPGVGFELRFRVETELEQVFGRLARRTGPTWVYLRSPDARLEKSALKLDGSREGCVRITAMTCDMFRVQLAVVSGAHDMTEIGVEFRKTQAGRWTVHLCDGAAY